MLTGFLCVQVLSAAREPILTDWDMPIWLFASSVILIAASAALLVWVRSESFPASKGNQVASLGLLFAALKPILFLLAAQDPGPLYVAIVLLTGSLCFLSIRYLVINMSIIITAWLLIAVSVLPVVTVASTLTIILLGAGLSVVVLNRRIAAAIGVYKLKQRVATLESILPMCASCKKTRDHAGNWKSVEEYIEDHQEGTQVSHGSCPSCTEELYGDLLKKRKTGDSAA